MKYAIVSNSGN